MDWLVFTDAVLHGYINVVISVVPWYLALQDWVWDGSLEWDSAPSAPSLMMESLPFHVCTSLFASITHDQTCVTSVNTAIYIAAVHHPLLYLTSSSRHSGEIDLARLDLISRAGGLFHTTSKSYHTLDWTAQLYRDVVAVGLTIITILLNTTINYFCTGVRLEKS